MLTPEPLKKGVLPEAPQTLAYRHYTSDITWEVRLTRDDSVIYRVLYCEHKKGAWKGRYCEKCGSRTKFAPREVLQCVGE